MSASPPTQSEREPEDELWVDRYLMPAIREPTLLPLLLVFIGHIVAFLAPLLLFAIRDGSFGSQLGLLLIVFLTQGPVRFEFGRKRRPYPLSWILLATWVTSGLTAWACDHYKLL